MGYYDESSIGEFELEHRGESVLDVKQYADRELLTRIEQLARRRSSMLLEDRLQEQRALEKERVYQTERRRIEELLEKYPEPEEDDTVVFFQKHFGVSDQLYAYAAVSVRISDGSPLRWYTTQMVGRLTIPYKRWFELLDFAGVFNGHCDTFAYATDWKIVE